MLTYRHRSSQPCDLHLQSRYVLSTLCRGRIATQHLRLETPYLYWNADCPAEPASAAKETATTADNKQAASANEPAQPLAPPPRPAQPATQQGSEAVDYFSTQNENPFNREPNPFEQSFGNPATDTAASKSLLPPVASLTSPATLAGESPSAGGYNFSNSLRSGPLSPAMLGGPVGASDYFDPSLRGTTFPSGVTPNESSLRTGLTPGGGGSMFPAPSPNSQALFQQLAGGSATPSTIDFHRTAMNAAAASKGNQFRSNGVTSQADDKRAPVAPMDPQLQQPPQATFGQHDNDAANGLFMLANASNANANNQFAVPNTSNAPGHQGRSQETSPHMAHGMGNGSLTGSIHGQSGLSGGGSDSGDQTKPTTRSRGKRASGGKAGGASNGRRKAEDTLGRQPSAKKAKNNATMSMAMDMEEPDSEEEMQNIKEEQYHENGKKMTDEEKRKNFLERNRWDEGTVFSVHRTNLLIMYRVAALKCRQRKKQWLANLQAKVEIFSTENDTLSSQVAALREEIVGLKTLLLQHKDCPVSQSQGLGGYFQQQEFNPHANPYGMGMQSGQQVMAGQRR